MWALGRHPLPPSAAPNVTVFGAAVFLRRSFAFRPYFLSFFLPRANLFVVAFPLSLSEWSPVSPSVQTPLSSGEPFVQDAVALLLAGERASQRRQPELEPWPR